MHTSITKKSETECLLSIQATANELQGIRQQTLLRLAPKVRVPGFREGHVPLELVEKQLDPNYLQSEFLQEAINALYLHAINQERLRPVNTPDVRLKSFVPYSALEFEADLEVVGEVTLPDYTKIKKTRPPVKVEAKEVTDVLDSLALRSADHKDVERISKDGDRVWIDFTGTDAKGQPVAGADGKDYPLVLGSKTFIPGFEENLVGLKSGDEKTFTVTFPKDYNVQALQGQKVTFAVAVKKVQEVVKSQLDDAFAAAQGPFKSLADLKEQIKKELTEQRTYEAELKFQDDLVKDIAAKSQVAVPKVLVDEQIEQMEREERQNLTYRGQTWEEHLASEGVNAEQHREQKREAAAERIKAGLVIAEIADKEGVTITPEELEIRLQTYKAQYKSDPRMAAELDKPENRREIGGRLMTEKTVAKLVTYATKKE